MTNKPKIRIFSDLHYDKYPDINDLFEKLDFYYKNVDKENEILVVAGDVGIATMTNESGETVINPEYSKVLKYLKSRWNRIILVPGNHEYYTSKVSVEKVNTIISNECEKYMIDFLNKDIVEIYGYTFLGCTLWSPMKYSVYETLSKKNWSFIDYDGILKLHQEHRDWLEYNLEKLRIKSDANGAFMRNKVIVITHYLFSDRILDEKFRTGNYPKFESAYVANLEDLIYKYYFLTPFWICGHTHISRYHKFKGTQTLGLCFPVGNPWECDHVICQEAFDLI